MFRLAPLLMWSLGCVVLNLLINPGNPLRGWQMFLAPGVAWESLALLALLPWLKSGGRWIVALLLPVGTALRLADIITPQLFGRAFIAPLDIAFAPQLLDLALAGTGSVARLALLAAILVAGVGLVWGLSRLVTALATPPRCWALGMVVALAIIWLPARLMIQDAPWFTLASGASLAEALRATIDTGQQGHDAVTQALTERPPLPASLPALAGRDVLLIFVESYGMVTRSAPSLADSIDPVRQRVADAVAAAGYQTASLALSAPITGGGSWLAHATTLAGLPIDSQGRHDALVLAAPTTLAGLLAADGHHRHAVQPQMHGPWPEGMRLGFQTVHTGDDLTYLGPRYSWNSLPDRFALDWTARTLLPPRPRPPIFAMLVLASSHAPFDRVPPLLSAAAGGNDGRGYNQQPGQVFPLISGNIRGQSAGFAAAIAYSLAAIGDFLIEQFPDDGLVIVMGDHQPPLDLVGGPQDKRVIAHILSRDAKLIAPWLAQGAIKGWHLPSDADHGPQSNLLARLVAAYGGP